MARKRKLTTHEQWQRLLTATLQFINDIRVAMSLPPLAKLPDNQTHHHSIEEALRDGIKDKKKAEWVTISTPSSLPWCEIPVELIDVSKLPKTLADRATLYDKNEPTWCQIEFPPIVAVVVKLLDDTATSTPVDPVELADAFEGQDVGLASIET